MKKDEFDAWERERIEWVKRTFSSYALDARKVDDRTVECRCVRPNFRAVWKATNTAYQFAVDVCRVMNGGYAYGGKWYVYEEPVYYDRNGHCLDPETLVDFDRVGEVEYVIDKED